MDDLLVSQAAVAPPTDGGPEPRGGEPAGPGQPGATPPDPDRQTGTAPAAGGRFALARRLWGLPLWAHALAVLAVLCCSVALTRPFTAYTSDEGAAILQARLLDRTGGWIIHDPVAPLDPEGRARPILRADVGPKGRAPYAKHPLYPLVLLAAGWIAGPTGYIDVSVLGTFVAAVAAALLAARFRADLARGVLWVIALGSPLLFDATWALAHSLAAASATLAALAVVAFLDASGCEARRRSPARVSRWALLAGGMLAVGVTAALRSEGTIFGLSLGLGLFAWAIRSRSRPAALAGAAVVTADAVAREVEILASRAILGRGTLGAIPGAPRPWLDGRLYAFRATVLQPVYDQDHRAVLLVVGVVSIAAAALAARRRFSPTVVLAAGGLATAMYGLWLVDGNRLALPGLLVAFPALAAALVCAHRSILRSRTGAVLAVSAAASVIGVLATEYWFGGGVEWGGRYFGLTLPMAAVPLAAGVELLLAPQRRALVAGLAGTSLMVSGVALVSSAHVHRQTADVFAAIDRCAQTAGSPTSPLLDDRPLVVSTLRLLPQIGWSTYDRYQWLTPPIPDLSTYLARAKSAGVRRLVLVTDEPGRDRPAGGYGVSGSCPTSTGLTVEVLRPDGA